MKRLILVLLASYCLFTANSQVVQKAIGARLSNGYGFGIEFSYQHPLTSHTRLELDAYSSFETNWVHLGGTVLHQWVFNIENGFQWYLGVGGSIGNSYYHYDRYDNYGKHAENESYLTLALNPNGGVEYNFKNIPLQLAVDGRPSINILNTSHVDPFHLSLGVAARYRF